MTLKMTKMIIIGQPLKVAATKLARSAKFLNMNAKSGYITILRGKWIELVLICLLFLVVSYDTYRDWDENTFLSRAAYAPLDKMGEWAVSHPTRAFWEKDWYYIKISHLCILHGLFLFFGTGKIALFCISFFYALLMLGFGGINFLILKELFKNKQLAYEASVLSLFFPASLFLSHKALCETTSLFFITLSIWLFLKGWDGKWGKRILFYLGSALFFLIATVSRIDVLILFYALGLAILWLYRSRVVEVLKRYIIITLFIVGALLIFYLFTGINPYISLFGQVIANVTKIPSRDIYNTILAGGAFNILLFLSIWKYKTAEFKFGLILLAVTALPVLLILNIVVVRYYYLSLGAGGLLAYLGLAQLDKSLRKKLLNRQRQWLISILLLVLVAGNVFIVRTLIDTGLKGNSLDYVIKAVKHLNEDALILIDSSTNTFAYARVAYPEMNFGLTIQGFIYDPDPIDDLDKLKRAIKRDPVVYLYPYNRQRSWLELCIDKIKCRGQVSVPLKKLNWMWDNTAVTMEQIASRGQYKAYLIKIKSESD